MDAGIWGDSGTLLGVLSLSLGLGVGEEAPTAEDDASMIRAAGDRSLVATVVDYFC